MISKIFTFFFTLTIAIQAPAQVIDANSDYQDLFDLYVFKKYEKCLKKADRYQDKDDRRRDPEPYLFLSVCYLQIHEHPENFDPELDRRALKNALKYAYRFKKRDKLELLLEKNRDHLQALRTAGLKQALHHLQQDDFRKAAYYLKWTNKVFPEDYATKLAYGMSQILNFNMYEGKKNIDLSHKLMQEELNDDQAVLLNDELRPIISSFLIKYIDHWNQKQNNKRALQTISTAHLLLGEKSDFWSKLN